MVPFEILLRWPENPIVRDNGESSAVVGIVVLPIAEIIVEPARNHDAQIVLDGYITSVEERMEVASEQDAVVDCVGPIRCKGLDMCGLQHRNGALARNGTASLVGICYQCAEATLANAVLSLGHDETARSSGNESLGRRVHA